MIENFFEIFVMLGNFVWLINDCFRVVKICGMLKKYKIVAYDIIYWYVNFWEIFGIFLVILLWKNNHVWLLEIIGMIGKL